MLCALQSLRARAARSHRTPGAGRARAHTSLSIAETGAAQSAGARRPVRGGPRRAGPLSL